MDKYDDEVNLCPSHEKSTKAPDTGVVDTGYQNPVSVEYLICSNQGNTGSSLPQAHSNTNIKVPFAHVATTVCPTCGRCKTTWVRAAV